MIPEIVYQCKNNQFYQSETLKIEEGDQSQLNEYFNTLSIDLNLNTLSDNILTPINDESTDDESVNDESTDDI